MSSIVRAGLGIAISMSCVWGSAEEAVPPPAATTPAAAEGPLNQEYLERWTPGGDTNAIDLPYPHTTASFQGENDDNWMDDRWQRTKKGPFLSHSIILPEYEVGPKLTAVAAGEGKFLLYDLRAGSCVAGVTAGELKTDPARFGLLNRPQLLGEVAFHIPAENMWRQGERGAAVAIEIVDYQGLYLHDDRVVFASRVAGVDVLESPLPYDDAAAVVREFELGPHPDALWLCVAVGSDQAQIANDGRAATWTDRQGKRRSVRINAASPGIRLEIDGAALRLHWPAAEGSASAQLSYRAGDDDNRVPAADASQAPIPPQLAAMRQPGGRRWGEPLASSGRVAEASDAPYVVDRIDPPHDNPLGALFFLAGLDFFPNGDAAICSAHGDVWIVRGLDAALDKVTWQRFATGLYQPLGLEVVDGQVIVLGRDQLTRLHDENGDGEADYYESFNHDLVIQGLPHAYAMRLERMSDDSFVFLKSGEGPHGSALLKLSPDGQQLDVLARGFRHPFGMGAGPNGEITVADNEGNWVPSSKIDLITPGGFYGFLGSDAEQGDNPDPLRPLCYIPKVADNSSGGQFWHISDAWGTYHRDGMFHFSWGRCTLHAVLQQQMDGGSQAATVEMPGVLLQAGPGEAEFHPIDGQLYVVGLDGWQTAAQVDGSFERIRYTGKPVRLPSSFAAHTDGIALGFDEPLDPQSLAASDGIRVEQWNYKWSSTYGSYHYSVDHPDRVGHDVVKVETASLSPDGKRLYLQIPGLKPVDQIQIALNLRTVEGVAIQANVYGTINSLASPIGADAAWPIATQSPETALQRLLAKENLVAWCIVPFDVKRRGPAERAAMLQRLGVRRIAYDWREEHVPQFDEELAAYDRHGITLHAFWTPVNTESPLAEPHWPLVLDLVKRHQLRPELWVMLNNSLVDALPEEARAQRAAEILAPVARAAAEHHCKIGLYNHGGWFGEPDHQVAIIKALAAMKFDNVGIVYNFHHGHEHITGYKALADRMAPHLMTVNVNGMRAGGPKILSFGEGNEEATMLDALIDAGYAGPIGILGHREERDAEECLQESLNGIERMVAPR